MIAIVALKNYEVSHSQASINSFVFGLTEIGSSVLLTTLALMASTGGDGEVLTCPFCDYKEKNDYQMLLHVEIFHAENGDSPFAVKDELEAAKQNQDDSRKESASPKPLSERSTPSHIEYVQCPFHCGEQVPADDLQFHTDFHVAEDMANQDAAAIDVTNKFSTDISNALRNHDEVLSLVQTPVREKRWVTSLRDMFSPPRLRLSTPATVKVKDGEVQRLGKAELGPYAHEKKMPTSLIHLLEHGVKVTVSNKIGSDGRIVKQEIVSNETPNLVPVLARLSFLDRRVTRAFYCNPFVRHVARIQGEGGFCGYRNLQMLISYIRDAQAPGHEHFDGKRLPSILRLQDIIEKAWDQGYNTDGRVETGGIRWTRKYIGTPEAQALLLSLGISAEALAFSAQSKSEAYRAMMEAICKHFDDGSEVNHGDKVVITDKPPLYFQHQGHSMTVVGVELGTDERANLMVFDPMYTPAKRLRDLAINNKLAFTSPTPEKLLKQYRRDDKYLARYRAFEMIKINGPV